MYEVMEYTIMSDVYDEYIDMHPAMEAFGKKKKEALPSDFKGKVKYRASQASKYASDKYGAAKKSVTKTGKNIKKTIKKIWVKIVTMFKRMEKRIDKIINTLLSNSKTLVNKGIKINITTNSKNRNINTVMVHDMGNTMKNIMIGAGVLFGGVAIAGGAAAVSAKIKQHTEKAKEVVDNANRFTSIFSSASSEEKESFISKFGKTMTGMFGTVNKKAKQAADQVIQSSNEAPDGTEEAQYESSEAVAKTTSAMNKVVELVTSSIGKKHEKDQTDDQTGSNYTGKFPGWKKLYENNPEKFAEEISKVSPKLRMKIMKDVGYRLS